MITEAEISISTFTGQLPQAPPGISGKLLSKCKKYRRSYMKSDAKVVGGASVYKIGAQVYMMRWYGPIPDVEDKSDWQNAYFVKRKEVPIEDEKVQEALAATFVMLRMDQKQSPPGPWSTYTSTGYSSYVTASSGYWSQLYASNTPYTLTTSSTYPYGLGTVSCNYGSAIAQAQQQQQASGSWNSLKKMLGMP